MDILISALKEYGVKELPGNEHNSPRILEYSRGIGMNWVKDDETAWCSIFINYIAKISGYERSNKPNARSWLNVGIEIEDPQPGDIVIFWRGSPDDWRGHVAIFVNEDHNGIWVLGGNQGNMVCIRQYAKYQLLGFRRLRKI